MPLTPEQIAKIRAKEAATPDALKRNPLNSYTEGWFHVTLNTRGEAPVLGYITGNAEATDDSQDAPRCVLTELGRKDEQGRPVLDAEGKPEMEEVPDITREMCMVMNEMVRMITKKADDWWK